MSFEITALSHKDPAKIVSNKDFCNEISDILHAEKYSNSKGVPYTADDIVTKAQRVGIKERKMVGVDENHISLSIDAIQNMKNEYGSDVLSDLDAIIVSTTTYDPVSKKNSIAQNISELLDSKSMNFDIQNACTGFLNSVSILNSMSGINKALLVSTDIMSTLRDYASPTTSLLFGDGCGVCLFERNSNNNAGILGTKNKAHPASNIYCSTKLDGKTPFMMHGREVYSHAVDLLPRLVNEYFDENNISINDFDFIVPHQANKKMIDEIGHKLGISPEKLLLTIEEYGNTASASIPITLSNHKNRFKSGNRILMFSIGAGMTLSLVDYRFH